MSDIVERLRLRADQMATRGNAETLREAADEIERLHAENFALAAHQCINVVGDETGTPICKEAKRLRAEVTRWREANRVTLLAGGVLKEQNDGLRAECLRLSHAEAEAMALVLLLEKQSGKLRAAIKNNVPNLITVARMPNQEHVADAHNRALDALLKVTR